jgi:hypothetical protein
LEITPELRLRDHMHAVQQTTEWKNRYKMRAGIEATHSELKRSHGIGRLRVRRLAKVCFAAACKLTACNIKRWARAYRALRALLRCFMSFMRPFGAVGPDQPIVLCKKQHLVSVPSPRGWIV